MVTNTVYAPSPSWSSLEDLVRLSPLGPIVLHQGLAPGSGDSSFERASSLTPTFTSALSAFAQTMSQRRRSPTPTSSSPMPFWEAPPGARVQGLTPMQAHVQAHSLLAMVPAEGQLGYVIAHARAYLHERLGDETHGRTVVPFQAPAMAMATSLRLAYKMEGKRNGIYDTTADWTQLTAAATRLTYAMHAPNAAVPQITHEFVNSDEVHMLLARDWRLCLDPGLVSAHVEAAVDFAEVFAQHIDACKHHPPYSAVFNRTLNAMTKD